MRVLQVWVLGVEGDRWWVLRWGWVGRVRTNSNKIMNTESREQEPEAGCLTSLLVGD